MHVQEFFVPLRRPEGWAQIRRSFKHQKETGKGRLLNVGVFVN